MKCSVRQQLAADIYDASARRTDSTDVDVDTDTHRDCLQERFAFFSFLYISNKL